MFKKTLLAAALAAATFGANAASVITTTVAGPEVISNQGLPATGAFTLVDGVILTLKATDDTGIVDTGRLVVSVTGAFFTNPAGATATVGGALANETVVIDATASTSTKLVFDLVANADDWTVADLDTITIDANTVALQISGSDVKMSAVFQTPTNVDVASTSAPAVSVAKAGDQWVAGVVLDLDTVPNASGALNALINVADDRQTFVNDVNSDSTTTDTLTFDMNTVGAGADINDVTVTVAGDFTNILSVVGTTTGGNAPATYTINTAKTAATFTYSTATAATVDDAELTGNDTALVFTLVTATANVTAMDVSEFTVSVDVDYDDAEGTQGDFSPLTAAAAGGFELNGSSVTLEYVPFGPNTALILQATSTFDEDASVSVSYLNPTTGLMVELEDIATATANSVSRLGPTIAAAIIADSGLESGKTRMTVTINAPDAELSLFTGFKDTSDKDRLGLPQT
jgi:hypothetical protein